MIRDNRPGILGVSLWRAVWGVVFLMICFSSVTLSQSSFSENLKLQFNYHKGVVAPMGHEDFKYVVNDYVDAYELSFLKKTKSSSVWAATYSFPEYGLDLFYSTLGNDGVFGKELAVVPFFRVKIVGNKRLQFYNKTGVGIGFVNNKFHVFNNPYNTAVGSYYNVHLNIRFGLKYQLTNQLEFNTGLSANHISNANIATPNLGVNTVTAYLGMSYKINHKDDLDSLVFEEHQRVNNFEAFVSPGAKYANTAKEPFRHFFTMSASLEANREITRAYHIGVGLDLFFDSSIKTALRDRGDDFSNLDNFQTGIHFAQSLKYGPLVLSVQQGVYLFLLEKINQNAVYNRSMLKYYVTDKFAVRLSMKSHFQKLDWPEFGFGLKW